MALAKEEAVPVCVTLSSRRFVAHTEGVESVKDASLRALVRVTGMIGAQAAGLLATVSPPVLAVSTLAPKEAAVEMLLDARATSAVARAHSSCVSDRIETRLLGAMTGPAVAGMVAAEGPISLLRTHGSAAIQQEQCNI